ncbi:hypothetical protein EXIGLDRAFT_846087 [Exidia glandulosa HHB12029]|uniref:Uncharacterized protein n=1 Tax=Exidia glandulosa HHB12029 TaxID=1314781 RepID=A0A165B5Y3_EXIGL|nr:hypothetical protein EXIGLDRAFT_846087 [Exidia glandulosa HHB12029]
MESIVTVDASYLFDDDDESAPQLPATTSVPTLSTLTPTPRVAGAASKNKENAQEHGELDADLRNRAKSKAIRNRHRVRKSSPLANVANMDVDEPLTPALANITNTTSLSDAVIAVKATRELSCPGPTCPSRSHTARTSPIFTDARPTSAHHAADMSNTTTLLDDVLPAAMDPALHEEVVDDVADPQPLDSKDTTASSEYPVGGLIESNTLSTTFQPHDSDDIPHVNFLDENIFGRMDDLPPRCSTPEPDHDIPFNPSLRLDTEHVPERRPTQKKHTDKQFHKLPLRLRLAEHIVEQKLWDEYERALEEHKRVKRLALAFRLQQEIQMLEDEDDDDEHEEHQEEDAEEEEENISAILHEAMEDSHGATVDASLGVPDFSAESLASTSTSMSLDTVVAQVLNAPAFTDTGIPPAPTIDIADLFSSEVNNAGATGTTTPTTTSVPDGMDPTSLPAPATASHDDTEYNAEADTTFDSVTYSAKEDGDIYADDDDDDDDHNHNPDTDTDTESNSKTTPIRPPAPPHTTSHKNSPKEHPHAHAHPSAHRSAHRNGNRKGNEHHDEHHDEHHHDPNPENNRSKDANKDAKNQPAKRPADAPHGTAPQSTGKENKHGNDTQQQDNTPQKHTTTTNTRKTTQHTPRPGQLPSPAPRLAAHSGGQQTATHTDTATPTDKRHAKPPPPSLVLDGAARTPPPVQPHPPPKDTVRTTAINTTVSLSLSVLLST